MLEKKKKRVKVGRDDLRMGNIFLHLENGYCKVCDLNGVFSVRVLASTPAGQMLRALFEQSKGGDESCLGFLKGYGSVLFNVCCSVPDLQLLNDLDTAARSSLERHKELYGLKDEVSEEEDAAALEEAREMYGAIEELRKEEGIEDGAE